MRAGSRTAQVSITFEIDIYRAGNIGREFTAALAERARQSLKVDVLLDGLGDRHPTRIGRLAGNLSDAQQAHECPKTGHCWPLATRIKELGNATFP